MIRYEYKETGEIFDNYDDVLDVALQDIPEDYYEDALLRTYSIGEILNSICEGNPSMWEDIITSAEDRYLNDTIEEVEEDDNED